MILLDDAAEIKKGSSTVFLSLVFAVIMMLFTAVIAILCYQAEKVNIKRGLDISMESEFGKFYRPLFDEYRLLYYMDSNDNAMSANVLSYFVENQKKMPGILKLKPSEFDIAEKYYATDNECSDVMRQMTGGILYTLGEDAVNSIYERISDISGILEKNNEVLDKASCEAGDSEDDALFQEKVLELLRMVEGIYIENGKIKCEKTYVKKGIVDDISAAGSGIDSSVVWEAVKKSKWDITKALVEMKKDKVKTSDDEYKKFLKRIRELSDITKAAYSLCTEIDNSISESARESCICDIHSLKVKLEDNVNILKGITETSCDVQSCISMFENYHVKDMYFDYSTLSLEKEDNPVDKLDSNRSDIVTFLMDDDACISDMCIPETDIYSGISESDTEIEDYPDFKKPEELSDYISACKSDCLISKAGERFLLNLYINKYFDSFVDTENNGDNEEDTGNGALSYEKEYIICGKSSDRQNIRSIIEKLLFIRTGISFAYLVSDKEKSNQAYITAAAVVGFTGMTALIKCTQYIILAGWAYEDACVDVSALINGKKIPLLKKKENFNIKYSEIISFNKEMVRQKAEKIEAKSGVGYSDLLYLFLNCVNKKRCLYRSMDIIHYNMKLGHSKLFSFQNAVYRAVSHISCSYPYYCGAESEYYYR